MVLVPDDSITVKLVFGVISQISDAFEVRGAHGAAVEMETVLKHRYRMAVIGKVI